MMATPIIIITGYPGTGKTSLGHHLADKFNIPFISKDEIKEIMFKSLGWSDREWSIKLGAASYDLMFYFAEKMLLLEKPFILETYFSKISEKEIGKLIKNYNILPLQIVCTANPDEIIGRVIKRVESGERHPGHVDHTRYDALSERVKDKYKKLEIGGRCIEIDTTDFSGIDYEEIYAFIQQNLRNGDYLQKTIDFVDRSFGKKKPHFDRTLYWLVQLAPKADVALKAAAYSHDIERAFKEKEDRKRLIYETKQGLHDHEIDSAKIMKKFLLENGAQEIMAVKVYDLISKHEEGGNEDQNLLKDSDSISYLETNALRNLEWLGEVPESEMREKFDWMYHRISSQKAKEIAKPFYDVAVEALAKKLAQG